MRGSSKLTAISVRGAGKAYDDRTALYWCSGAPKTPILNRIGLQTRGVHLGQLYNYWLPERRGHSVGKGV